MRGIYGGIAFAGLLALVFGGASRRHPYGNLMEFWSREPETE